MAGNSISKKGPKFTKMQREQACTFVEECLGQGIPYRSIVKRLKKELGLSISLGMVTGYKNKLYKRHAQRQTKSRDELVAEKKHQFAVIREYAWKALAKSEHDIESIIEECGPLPEAKDRNGKVLKPKQGGRDEALRIIKRIHEKQGRLPANEWMKVIIDTLKEEMRLDALVIDIHIGDKVAGDKVGGDKTEVTIDWNKIMEPGEITDPAREAIEAKGFTVKQEGDEA